MELDDIRLFRETMRHLQRSLNWQWKSDAACCGINVAQCHALLEGGNRGEIAQVELSSILGLDTSTLSRTIEGMAQDGIVERKADPEDRRYINIVLAEQGKEVYGDINHTLDHYYAEIFADIPADKHKQIVESVNLLVSAISNPNSSKCCKEELAK